MPLIAATLPLLHEQGLRVGPVVIASEARVALADEVGECLQAAMVVMLIGERPGLSSPDSLGCISPAHHAAGRMDSERNCISNVRPQGLPYPLAAYKLAWLIRAGRGSGTGVALKDGSAAEAAGCNCKASWHWLQLKPPLSTWHQPLWRALRKISHPLV
jgi:ethanolamine ammonia-lyase small subunit